MLNFDFTDRLYRLIATAENNTRELVHFRDKCQELIDNNQHMVYSLEDMRYKLNQTSDTDKFNYDYTFNSNTPIDFILLAKEKIYDELNDLNYLKIVNKTTEFNKYVSVFNEQYKTYYKISISGYIESIKTIIKIMHILNGDEYADKDAYNKVKNNKVKMNLELLDLYIKSSDEDINIKDPYIFIERDMCKIEMQSTTGVCYILLNEYKLNSLIK